jgi:hypothetical protein
MAAIAACRSYGLSREQIVNRLKTFRSDTNNREEIIYTKSAKGSCLSITVTILTIRGYLPHGVPMERQIDNRNNQCGGDRENRIVEEAAKVAATVFIE